MNAPAAKQVYVCEGQDCGGKGSLALVDKLRLCLKEQPGGEGVEVKTYPCFGGCGHGINVVVHPDRLFYSEISEADLAPLAASLTGARPPLTERTGKVDPDVADLAYDLVAAGF